MGIKIKVEMEVSDQRISDLLCSAFEGGSNYWYMQLDHELPEGISFEEFRAGGARQPKDGYCHWCQLIPLVEGCALTLRVQDDPVKIHRITRECLEKGMGIFAKKYPYHFADFINENDDADTGDVFLQCVVFGDVIYG
jgi:hypothetical protein